MNCHKQSADATNAPSNGAHVRDKTNIAREWAIWLVLIIGFEGLMWFADGRVSERDLIVLSIMACLIYVGLAVRLLRRIRSRR